MQRNEHKRVKHGELPGDIARRGKIKMREKRAFYAFPWQFMGRTVSKAFRRHLSEKGRTVQRRRDQRAIDAGLSDEGA